MDIIPPLREENQPEEEATEPAITDRTYQVILSNQVRAYFTVALLLLTIFISFRISFTGGNKQVSIALLLSGFLVFMILPYLGFYSIKETIVLSKDSMEMKTRNRIIKLDDVGSHKIQQLRYGIRLEIFLHSAEKLGLSCNGRLANAKTLNIFIRDFDTLMQYRRAHTLMFPLVHEESNNKT